MGTHDELMSADGLYRDLFTLQADRYGFAAMTTSERMTVSSPADTLQFFDHDLSCFHDGVELVRLLVAGDPPCQPVRVDVAAAERLLPHLAYHRLLPQLVTAVRSGHLVIRDDIAQEVEGLSTGLALDGLRLEHMLLEVGEVFEQAGVEFLVLKGVATGTSRPRATRNAPGCRRRHPGAARGPRPRRTCAGGRGVPPSRCGDHAHGQGRSWKSSSGVSLDLHTRPHTAGRGARANVGGSEATRSWSPGPVPCARARRTDGARGESLRALVSQSPDPLVVARSRHDQPGGDRSGARPWRSSSPRWASVTSWIASRPSRGARRRPRGRPGPCRVASARPHAPEGLRPQRPRQGGAQAGQDLRHAACGQRGALVRNWVAAVGGLPDSAGTARRGTATRRWRDGCGAGTSPPSATKGPSRATEPLRVFNPFSW